MLIHNYNTLGKLGPHYERPEYRPPEPPPAQTDGRSPAAEQRGDRRTLSTKNTSVKKNPIQPAGRLNLSEARSLVADTAALVRALPPQSTTREPHSRASFRLMTPIYV